MLELARETTQESHGEKVVVSALALDHQQRRQTSGNETRKPI